MLLRQVVRLALSRTFWTAGTSRAMRIAMIAMTTRSSIRVNAGRERGDEWGMGMKHRLQVGQSNRRRALQFKRSSGVLAMQLSDIRRAPDLGRSSGQCLPMRRGTGARARGGVCINLH